jgi:glycosyltransferase involved in cell wall biosynthesis
MKFEMRENLNAMIIHMTTVHPRDDSRIRSKELNSLAKAFGGQVAFFVQDGLGCETCKDLDYEIVDTGPRLPRLRRIFVGGARIFKAVLRARPRLVHFHDPELLPWALLLKFWGIKIVYDVHEDVPQQVKHTPGLNKFARKFLPPIIWLAEWIGARILDGIVVPTPTIADRFPRHKTALVRNYPLLNELHIPAARPMRDRPREFAYVGYISVVRNIFGMMKAMARMRDPETRLRLVGSFALAQTEAEAKAMPEWARVKFDGWASREGVASAMADARAGLVLLLPVEHEMLTYPIKLFEYMAAGLPVIASDFPVWRAFVEESACGLVVDPQDCDAIVDAMQWMLYHPDEAHEMGLRGRKAVEDRLNWECEAATLVAFYRERLRI